MPETNTAGNPFLARAYGLSSAEDCKALYDDWAATFDSDLNDPSQEYVAPAAIAKAVLKFNGNIGGSILDAGCGTGLSGVALFQAGAKNIHGLDISPGMLKVAEKTGAYQKLATADLTKPVDAADGSFDVVTCVGTFTHGHVGPTPALREFVRVLKKGGLIVATVLDDIWSSGGFEAEVEQLQKEGLTETLSTENADYRKGAGVKARTLVLRKN